MPLSRWDRVSYMVDTNDDRRRIRGRVEIRTGVIRRRRWTDEEKGRIVVEAILPDAVIADVARRHDLAPQHLSNWIRAAKDGRFALPACAKPELRFGEGRPAENDIAFVPVIASGAPRVESAPPPEASTPIEIAVGSFVVRVPNGADARTLEAVMRAVRRAAA
jgi:transposase